MNFDISRLLLSLSPTKWLIFANNGLKHHDVKLLVPKSNFHIHPSLHPSVHPSIHLPPSACGLCLHLTELLRVSIFHINPTYIFVFLITVCAVKWPVVMMFAYCLFFPNDSSSPTQMEWDKNLNECLLLFLEAGFSGLLFPRGLQPLRRWQIQKNAVIRCWCWPGKMWAEVIRLTGC